MTLCSVPRRYLQTPGDPGTIGVTSEIYQQFPSFHTNLRLDFFFFFSEKSGRWGEHPTLAFRHLCCGTKKCLGMGYRLRSIETSALGEAGRVQELVFY